jgi:hypothetical protein
MAGEIDTATQVLDRILPDLHADSYANLTFWTKGQLVDFCDQGAKDLSRKTMVFCERDSSTATVAGTASYPLPPRHDATIHVSYATTPLRPATTVELESRDPNFLTTPGTPTHWYQDDLPIASIGLAPVPTAAVSLPMVCNMYPPDLDTAQVNTLLQAPAPVAIYLSYYVLWKAYGAEGESEIPDLAQHCKAQCQLLEQVLQHLYGEGG